VEQQYGTCIWNNEGLIYYLMTLIHEHIRSRFNSDNACYHSVQKHFFSCLLSKNVEITIYKTIILLVVLYGCETWSLTLREEGVEEIFGLKRDEVTGGWRKLHNEDLHNLHS
jgi:hypothetical protein